MEKINILVFGTGGIGGYVGGLLVNTNKNNYHITFIARGEHLKAIKKNGLELRCTDGESMICKPDSALDDIKETVVPDIIIIAVKIYDLEYALNQISGIVGKDTIILPLMNGLDVYRKIRKKIKRGIVIPSCIYMTSYIEKPGVIVYRQGRGFLVLGEDPLYNGFYPEILLDLLNNSGINYNLVNDIDTAIWEKFIFVAPYSLVTAFADKTIGEVFSDYILKDYTRKIMLELYELGKAKGINLDDYTVENSINRVRLLPHSAKTSFQRDIELKGSKNESDIFAESIFRLSKEMKIPVPMTQIIYSKVLERINSKKQIETEIF